MNNDRDVVELIVELSRLSILAGAVSTQIGFLDGVRHIGSLKPVPKSEDQALLEKRNEETFKLIKRLKQKISEKLEIKEEVKQVWPLDFMFFLMINFKKQKNGEIVRINEKIILPNEATPDMLCNFSLF